VSGGPASRARARQYVSTLHLTRALVALRPGEPDQRRAPVRFRDARTVVLVLDRGDLRVTLDLSDRPPRLGAGGVLLGTAPLDGGALAPWAGAIGAARAGKSSYRRHGRTRCD
jgi:hypothetical protein